MNCPSCQSKHIVHGRIIADGSDNGSAESFFPLDLSFFTLRRSVRLVGRQTFKACTQCGHVWNTLDAGGLRELIETSGTDELKKSIRSSK